MALASQGVRADRRPRPPGLAGRRRRRRVPRANDPQAPPPAAPQRADRSRRARRPRRRDADRLRRALRRLRAVHGDALRHPATAHRREAPGDRGRAALDRRAHRRGDLLRRLLGVRGPDPGNAVPRHPPRARRHPRARGQAGGQTPRRDRAGGAPRRPRLRPHAVSRQPPRLQRPHRRHRRHQAREPRSRRPGPRIASPASRAEPAGRPSLPFRAMPEAITHAPKRVLLAAPRGYCAGVDRAVQTVEHALDLHGAPVYVRKEIVHNKHVVQQLSERGAIFVEEETEVPEGALVVFSAHGVSPAVHANAASRRLRTIDATCPLVTKVHVEARKFAEAGLHDRHDRPRRPRGGRGHDRRGARLDRPRRDDRGRRPARDPQPRPGRLHHPDDRSRSTRPPA